MAFQLKVRGISKEDETKLCRKYSKLLKKGKADRMEVVCKLFLELIYIYFNNPKRKLYKLFFCEITRVSLIISVLILGRILSSVLIVTFSIPF